MSCLCDDDRTCDPCRIEQNRVQESKDAYWDAVDAGLPEHECDAIRRAVLRGHVWR